MKRNHILKNAVVLLIGVFLICTSVTSYATTDEGSISTEQCEIITQIPNVESTSAQSDILLWDNYIATWRGAYHSQDDTRTANVDSNVADDFMFEEETDVHWIYWQMVYWNCNYAEGPKDYRYDWNITFFEDDGSGWHPGDIYAGPFNFKDEDIFKSKELVNSTTVSNGYWGCGAAVVLPEPLTFVADTKYWMTAYSYGPLHPQSGWPVHNESVGGIRLHEGNFKAFVWGYPDWTNLSIVDGEKLDANFILGGEFPADITINKGIGVSATITHMLTEPPYNTPATNVTVTFTASGGFVLNPTKTINIGNLDPGETVETPKWFPIGLGRITIKVEINTDDGFAGLAEDTGILLLFFVL
jgi:hypothetical protein